MCYVCGDSLGPSVGQRSQDGVGSQDRRGEGEEMNVCFIILSYLYGGGNVVVNASQIVQMYPSITKTAVVEGTVIKSLYGDIQVKEMMDDIVKKIDQKCW